MRSRHSPTRMLWRRICWSKRRGRDFDLGVCRDAKTILTIGDLRYSSASFCFRCSILVLNEGLLAGYQDENCCQCANIRGNCDCSCRINFCCKAGDLEVHLRLRRGETRLMLVIRLISGIDPPMSLGLIMRIAWTFVPFSKSCLV
jgi:hypothetical protein